MQWTAYLSSRSFCLFWSPFVESFLYLCPWTLLILDDPYPSICGWGQFRTDILVLITFKRILFCQFYSKCMRLKTCISTRIGKCLAGYLFPYLSLHMNSSGELSGLSWHPSSSWTLSWPYSSSSSPLSGCWLQSTKWSEWLTTPCSSTPGSVLTLFYAASWSDYIVVPGRTRCWMMGSSVAESGWGTSSMYPTAGVCHTKHPLLHCWSPPMMILYKSINNIQLTPLRRNLNEI